LKSIVKDIVSEEEQQILFSDFLTNIQNVSIIKFLTIRNCNLAYYVR